MKPEEARKWVELYTAIAEGRKWQMEIRDPEASGRRWEDAKEDDDPGGWCVQHVRVKPEPQIVYVATWFEKDGKVSAQSSSNASSLENWASNRPGFRIDVIERELP